jgi:hypothetical protein
MAEFDPEIEAIQRAYDQLACLDTNGRIRALAYLESRFRSETHPDSAEGGASL